MPVVVFIVVTPTFTSRPVCTTSIRPHIQLLRLISSSQLITKALMWMLGDDCSTGTSGTLYLCCKHPPFPKMLKFIFDQKVTIKFIKFSVNEISIGNLSQRLYYKEMSCCVIGNVRRIIVKRHKQARVHATLYLNEESFEILHNKFRFIDNSLIWCFINRIPASHRPQQFGALKRIKILVILLTFS